MYMEACNSQVARDLGELLSY